MRWALANPEKTIARKIKYYEANKEKISLSNKETYPNRARVQRERSRLWRLNNPDKNSKYMKQWRKDNSDLVRIHKQTRHALKANAQGTLTKEDVSNLYATQGGSCYYCSVDIEGGYHIEHMVPLSRGGDHDVSNICLACATCNLRKGTKTDKEFNEATG